MRVIISQPRYLPVTSYLQRLYHADTFILLDNVQRQSRGWENRNKLLLPTPKWLTIPIASSSRAMIFETEVKHTQWLNDHARAIATNYKNAPHYNQDLLDDFFEVMKRESVNSMFFTDIITEQLNFLCSLFDFKPNFVRASEIETDAIREAIGPDKLCELCKAVDATEYISGGNGKEYGVEESFAGSSIDVLYHNPKPPIYSQGAKEFEPYMACLDMIFNAGLEKTSTAVKADLELTR